MLRVSAETAGTSYHVQGYSLRLWRAQHYKASIKCQRESLRSLPMSCDAQMQSINMLMLSCCCTGVCNCNQPTRHDLADIFVSPLRVYVACSKPLAVRQHGLHRVSLLLQRK